MNTNFLIEYELIGNDRNQDDDFTDENGLFIPEYMDILRIEDNNYITVIDATNTTLRKIILYNCFALEELRFESDKNLEVSITNCPNLKNLNAAEVEGVYSDYIYIENCLKLKYIIINNFNSVKISDGYYYSLNSILLSRCNNIEIRYEQFQSLNKVFIVNCILTRPIVINNKYLSELTLINNVYSQENSSYNVIHIEGDNDYLKTLNIVNTMFNRLIINNALTNINVININYPNFNIPIIPLPDNPIQNIRFYFYNETIYPNNIYYFITDNKNMVTIFVDDVMTNNLDDVIFYIP